MKLKKEILILWIGLLTLNCIGQKVINNGVLKSLKIEKKGKILLSVENTTDTSRNSTLRTGEVKWKNKGTSSIFIYEKGRKAKGLNYEVHYIGFFENGLQFDNSFSRGEPLKFNLQDNYLLASFSKAIQNFREGGIGLIRINPEDAYGNKPTGNIPANSTLYYLIHVTSIN